MRRASRLSSADEGDTRRDGAHAHVAVAVAVAVAIGIRIGVAVGIGVGVGVGVGAQLAPAIGASHRRPSGFAGPSDPERGDDLWARSERT